MRLPAQRSIDHQMAYPAQSEGGYPGDTCRALKAALAAWEAKRGVAPLRYGRAYPREAGVLKNKRGTTRDEISWNPKPEVKRPAKPKPPKKPKRTQEELRAMQKRYVQAYRAKMSQEKREAMLARKRELYHQRAQTTRKNQPPALTPGARRERTNERNRLYRAKIKAGLHPLPASKTSEKRKEYRVRYEQRRQHSAK
jgi:hypothetical protein